jgi:uncharacterized lipoprotein YehR (DUF1307 family)
MKNSKRKDYFPSERDMVNVHEVINVAKIGFSVEKCIGGFHVVKYNLDDNGVALKNTITYKRIDTTKKDTPTNRVVYSTQNEAEEEIFNLYRQTADYYGLAKVS